MIVFNYLFVLFLPICSRFKPIRGFFTIQIFVYKLILFMTKILIIEIFKNLFALCTFFIIGFISFLRAQYDKITGTFVKFFS